MWQVPEGFIPTGKGSTQNVDATLRISLAEYESEHRTAEPGLLLLVVEKRTLIRNALPSCVINLAEPLGGRAPTLLKGLSEADGTIFAVEGQTVWDYRNGLRSKASLQMVAQHSKPVEGAELVAALRHQRLLGFTSEDLVRFDADKKAHDVVRREVLSAIGHKFDSMGARGRGEVLYRLAQDPDFKGFEMQHLGGGVEALGEMLRDLFSRSTINDVLDIAQRVAGV